MSGKGSSLYGSETGKGMATHTHTWEFVYEHTMLPPEDEWGRLGLTATQGRMIRTKCRFQKEFNQASTVFLPGCSASEESLQVKSRAKEEADADLHGRTTWSTCLVTRPLPPDCVFSPPSIVSQKVGGPFALGRPEEDLGPKRSSRWEWEWRELGEHELCGASWSGLSSALEREDEGEWSEQW
jgi:hypothetical protein